MQSRRVLRKTLRKVRRLSKWDYNEKALIVMLIRVWAGHEKTGKNLVDDATAANLSEEIHRRLNWFEGTNDIRHVIDGLRYYFGMLSILMTSGWDDTLSAAYKRYLKDGKVTFKDLA